MVVIRTRIFTTDSAVYETDPFFDWLCYKAGINDQKSYFTLAAELHRIAFNPMHLIETDKNRAQDGLELRVEFMERYGAQGSAKNRGPCSMLEFLVGLARQMSFIMCDLNGDVEAKTSKYFFVLLGNLGLLKLDDNNYIRLNGDFYVSDAVDRVLNRQYESSGKGGLFPLKGDHGDQKCAEIWYQMQFWLGEHLDI